MTRTRLDWRIEDGESFDDVRKRHVPSIERLVRHYGSPEQGMLRVPRGDAYWVMAPLVFGER